MRGQYLEDLDQWEDSISRISTNESAPLLLKAG